MTAKEMEAIDVILIDREDFPVAAFSFGKSAGSMMPQRRVQQLGNLMRGVASCAGRRGMGICSPLFRRHSSLFAIHRTTASARITRFSFSRLNFLRPSTTVNARICWKSAVGVAFLVGDRGLVFGVQVLYYGVELRSFEFGEALAAPSFLQRG